MQPNVAAVQRQAFENGDLFRELLGFSFACALEHARGQPRMMALKKDRFYLPELDGLRFFAFAAVFLSHLAVFNNGDSSSRPALVELCNMFGRFGVDLFFALSAYLLTRLMLAERAKTGGFDLRAFYVRRLLRIWPLYFAWLFVLILTRRIWSDYSLSFFLPFLLFGGNFVASFGVVTSIVILPLWS